MSKPTHPFHKAAKELERCPYDTNHHIPKTEMETHMKDCPSKREIPVPKTSSSVPSWRKSVVKDKSESSNAQVAENWDTNGNEDDWETPQTGYNPQEKILNSNKPIL